MSKHWFQMIGSVPPIGYLPRNTGLRSVPPTTVAQVPTVLRPIFLGVFQEDRQ